MRQFALMLLSALLCTMLLAKAKKRLDKQQMLLLLVVAEQKSPVRWLLPRLRAAWTLPGKQLPSAASGPQTKNDEAMGNGMGIPLLLGGAAASRGKKREGREALLGGGVMVEGS